MKNTLLILLLCTSLLGQDTIKLKEVQVVYQANKKTPVSFQNLKTPELRLFGQEPSAVLVSTPSISSYSDSGYPQGYSYIRIRGIDQTRVNISFDDIPLNDPEDQGAYFSNHPDILSSVSSIQIQRGLGTLKNGTASYGGSIQLYSKSTEETSVGISYGSFNTRRSFIETGNGSFYGRFSEVSSDGFKYHSGNRSQSSHISYRFGSSKSSFKISSLAGHQKNNLAWLGVSSDKLNQDRRSNGNSEAEKDDFFQILSSVKNTYDAGKAVINSCFYHIYLNGYYDFDLNNFLGQPLTDELYRYSFRSNLFGVFSNVSTNIGDFNVTTGVHANTYKRSHIGSEKSLGNLYENAGFKREASVFVKTTYPLGDFSLFSEIQYRYTDFNYEGSVSLSQLDWNFLNSKAGITYSLENTDFYYSIGRTGREPTRNDMFGGNDDLLSDKENPLLFTTNAEYVVGQECGVRYGTSDIKLGINIYLMNFQNEIVLDGKFGKNGIALTNDVESSKRAGVELSFHYKTGIVETITNSSYNYSRIKEGGLSFSPILSPEFILNQELRINMPWIKIGLFTRSQSHSFIDFSNENTIEGYTTLGISAEKNLGKLTLSVIGNNITDQSYNSGGYVDWENKYFTQAGFTLLGSLKYRLW